MQMKCTELTNPCTEILTKQQSRMDVDFHGHPYYESQIRNNDC